MLKLFNVADFTPNFGNIKDLSKIKLDKTVNKWHQSLSFPILLGVDFSYPP